MFEQVFANICADFAAHQKLENNPCPMSTFASRVRSAEQKQLVLEEITDTLERVAHKPKSYTYIAFDELPHESWAIAGTLLGKED